MSKQVILFIGTKRGLFVARSDADRREWTISDPLLVGREIYHALLDPRDNRTAWAASDHKVWGAHIHRSDDQGESWDLLEEAPHYADDRGLKAIWSLTPGPDSAPSATWPSNASLGRFVLMMIAPPMAFRP